MDHYENELKIAQKLYDECEYKKALERFKVVLTKTKDNTDALIGKRNCLKDLNMDNDEQEYLAINIKIANKRPNDIETLFIISDCLLSRGKYNDAVKYLDQIIKINPDNAQAWCNKANNLLALKKCQKAYECCQKALGLNPKLNEARILLEKAEQNILKHN